MRTKIKFYLLLIVITFIVTACNEDRDKSKNKETNLSLTKNDDSYISENLMNMAIKPDLDQTLKREENAIEAKATVATFTFKNLENQISILNVKNDIYDFENIKEPLVMLNLSSTWCPPCRGEVPHLSSLQKKFQEELFILTALVHDNIKDNELKKLIISEKAHFFVSTDQEENLKFEKMIIKKLGIVDSFNLPLMVLFANGKYFTHYEGSMPEEMIESDLNQLLEKIKERKQ